MPQVGEIRKGAGRQKSIWAICEICGKARWSSLYKGKAKATKCKHCSDKINSSVAVRFIKDNWHFKDSRFVIKRGYALVKIAKDDFFYPMARKNGSKTGLVLEHRLVMAKHLGRCLTSFEVVHHKNGIKDDNQKENLELSTVNAHSKDHNKGYKDGYLKGYQDGKGRRIEELEARIKELEGKWN